MDIDATYAKVMDETLPGIDRLEALDIVRDWMNRDGFPPKVLEKQLRSYGRQARNEYFDSIERLITRTGRF